MSGFTCAHLGHGGVLPEAQLVLAEPMAAQDLLLMPAPLQCTDLQRIRTQQILDPRCGKEDITSKSSTHVHHWSSVHLHRANTTSEMVTRRVRSR